MKVHVSDLMTGEQLSELTRILCNPGANATEWKAGSQIHHLRQLILEIRDQLACLRKTDGYKHKFDDTFTVGDWLESRMGHFTEMLDRVAEESR